MSLRSPEGVNLLSVEPPRPRRKSATYMDTSSLMPRSSIQLSATPSGYPVKYENTYRVEPTRPANVSPMEKLIAQILENRLRDEVYDQETCQKLTKDLSEELRNAARKLMANSRFKIVTNVVIGQKQKSTLSMVSRCIWNDGHDKRSEASYSNFSLYAVGIVFAVYFE